MDQASPTFYEFFAGGGMARAGLGDSWRCLFANDFDPIKTSAYLDNYPDAAEHLRTGDVFELKTADLPGRADLAWASSPCQDFSLAGSRAGLKGGRSSAFFGFWALIEALSKEGRAPSIVVIENVVGLLTSHKGEDFQALCQCLADQGYYFGAVEIDAARFVPQSRPRVFVVATKLEPDCRLSVIEPIAPFHSRRVASSYEKLPTALQEQWIWWRLEYPPRHNAAIDTVLESDEVVTWLSEEKTTKILSYLGPTHREKLRKAKARTDRNIGTLFRRMRTEDGKKVQRAELRFDGFAGCLRPPGGGSSTQFIVVVEGESVRLRRLTKREAARLMGLRDDYDLPSRNGSALKVLGDGVVVPVVSFLREQIIEPLARQSEQTNNDSAKEGRRARA